MVSEYPVDTSNEGSATIGVRGAAEVPKGASGTNDELGDTDHEGVDPEVSEESVKEHISGFLGPLNGEKCGNFRHRFDLTDREDEKSHDQPYCEPGHQLNDSDWWHQEDLRSTTD